MKRSPLLQRARLAALAWAGALMAACAAPPAPPAAAPEAPEAASGYTAKPGWHLGRAAVAAANPLAAQAGLRMLDAGGSALDAAVAVQLVLGLVEPQSSGIGGGAFLLYWDGRRVEAFDGRETAPAEADEALFLEADGRPMGFRKALVGGRSVGVPGTLRMLEAAHRRHGRLPWARLFEPAIELAEQGFVVSPRLAALLRSDAFLKTDPRAAAYFYPRDGEPLEAGQKLRNPALAAVMRRIAAQGADALHRGPIAQDIVQRVRTHADNPGRISAHDLENYRPLQREALCSPWRRYRVCGFPPPSSGHLTMMQVLGLLEQVAPPLQPPADALPSPAFLHTYAEAARLAFADRAAYIADPGFVAPPAGDWLSLLAPAYLRERVRLIGPRAMPLAPAGVPAGANLGFAPSPEQPEHGTSHVSIVDAQGHVVAMTTTIEDQFGARLLVDGGTGLDGGFLLNNELTDFSFVPADAQGRPVANRVQPGKRPRSSMSPTLVFDRDSGELLLSAGSPGGAMIIHYTAKTLLGSLVWGLDPQAAIDLPNFGSTGGPLLLEAGRFPASTVDALRERGHDVREAPLTSGIQALQRTPAGWRGGADPRREGVVVGR